MHVWSLGAGVTEELDIAADIGYETTTFSTSSRKHSYSMPKILIVDDDPPSRRLAAHILKTAGYEVVMASDGLETIEKIWKERPDLVLLDVMMPQRDGIETLRQLRRIPELRETRVIMLTAVADRARVVEILQMGVKGYLVKPFSPEALREKVAIALKKEEEESLESLLLQ